MVLIKLGRASYLNGNMEITSDVIASEDSSIIRENDTVILRMYDDKSTCMLKVKGEQKIGKSKVKVTGLIGHPYGSIFEVIDRKLVKVTGEDNIFESSLADGSGDNSGYKLLVKMYLEISLLKF